MKPFAEQIEAAIEILRSHRVMLEKGLSNSEIKNCERRFNFQFPPDHREFLRTVLPLSPKNEHGRGFPNWREPEGLTYRMDLPFDGILFDIEGNGFWREEWGTKPDRWEDMVVIARGHFQSAPKLIPIYSHRYLPSEPWLAGNPVFSVHQTDIIYYGVDLWDYFENEFGPEDRRWKRLRDESASAIRQIPFWSEFTE